MRQKRTMNVMVDGCMGLQECSVTLDDGKDEVMLRKLVQAAIRFRKTPIVDDDFCSMRDEFDALLDEAEKYLQ